MAVQRPEAEQRLPESELLTRELDELDTALAELKAHYEQYFLGVERQKPARADADVRQRLAKLRTGYVRSAVLKFRIQSLQQRFTTYDRLWQRTLTEMENGTYRRDLFKARRRRKTGDMPVAAPRAPEAKAPTPEVEPDFVVVEEVPVAAAPKAPPAPIPTTSQGAAVRPSPVPSVKPVAIPAGTQGGASRAPRPGIPQGTQGGVARAAAEALAEPRLRAVYDAYLAAKKRCREDVSRISYESVADSLRKQVPELLQRHGARDVEYKVLVKDGKAVLRAVPKS